MLTNKDISLTVRGRLYSSCVRSSMLHGSETWPVRKENEVALQRAEMIPEKRHAKEQLQEIKFYTSRVSAKLNIKVQHLMQVVKYNTHTHSRFTALLEFVRDHPGEQVPER